MNSESNESNEINRIYKCTKNDNTITLNMNENPVYKEYFEQLNRVHTNIDMKHDQYDFSRVNARMRNDEKYAYVSAWEYIPESPSILHKEDLNYEFVEMTQRNYK